MTHKIYNLLINGGLITSLFLFGVTNAQAITTNQYTSTMTKPSSQPLSDAWSAIRVLGIPNTFSYDTIPSDWISTPIPAYKKHERTTVKFTTTV